MRSVRAKFLRACALLRECTDEGYHIYVAGAGSMHLLSGPSHDDPGCVARRDRIVETVGVPNASGGDW